MARQFLTNLDLALNQLLNAVLQSLPTGSPASPVEGQFWYNSTSGRLTYQGRATPGGTLLAIDPTARGNHTGSQTASTISDLAATVQAYRLDQFAAPTNPVGMGGQRIVNQADPVNPQDSATKNYVDTNIQAAQIGIAAKPAVRVVSTANVSALSGLQTIDAVSLAAGDRVLLTAQTTASQNGSWVVASGAWTRPSPNELEEQSFWFVGEGTTGAGSQWKVTNTGTITPGTTAITIVQWGAGSSYTASNGLQLSGQAFSVKPSTGILATAAGTAVDTTVVTRKFAQAIGDGSTSSFTVTHNLGTQDVVVSLYASSGGFAEVEADIQHSTANTITVGFASAPASGAFRVVVHG